VAGSIALVHDVLVLVGIFALIGYFDRRMKSTARLSQALLTVVGYSINDSVVIFDRLRENLRNRRKEPFDKVVNDSLLETMSRSINTGLTVIIMLFVLLFFGGESIYNFVLAMLIGIASGLYSSIFNASMVLVAWNRWDEKKQRQARPVRGAATPARVASSTASTRAASSSAGAAAVTTPRRTTFASTAAPTAPAAGTSAPSAPTATPSTPTTSAPTHSAQTQPLDDTSSVTGPPIEVVAPTEPIVGTASDQDFGESAADGRLDGGLEDSFGSQSSDADGSDADDVTMQTSTDRGGSRSRPASTRKSRAKRRY
jgi:hypothetical protein